MLELWWWQATEVAQDWCAARRHWLAEPPADGEALLSQLVRRELLARHTGIAPAAQQFVIGAKGKPQLLGSDLHFSVTHSFGWHLCLLADAPCGVDVEPWDRRLDKLLRPPVLKRFAERDAIATGADFLRCWSMKEAWAKCLGTSVWQQLGEPLAAAADGWRVPGMASGYAPLAACVAWAVQSPQAINPTLRAFVPA